MEKKRKADIYAEEIAAGMSVKDVAEKYGVTRSAVYACVPGPYRKYFKPFTEKACVYPNLRNWLNENKVTKMEFVRRMNRTVGGDVYANVTDWFAGRAYPSKKVIDAILKVTGLTYEELWSLEEAKPMTNGDRIRSMSDEELAKAIRIHVGSSEDVACCYCHGDKGCINADGEINCDDKTEETCIVAWLRQPVTQPNPGADDNHDHSGLLEE